MRGIGINMNDYNKEVNQDFNSYNELLTRFSDISDVKDDVAKALVGFLTAVRYFGADRMLNNLYNGNMIDNVKALLKSEQNEITSLLKDLAFEVTLDKIQPPSLDKIVSFINKFIKSQEMVKDLIDSNTFYLLLDRALDRPIFEKAMCNKDIIENKLRIFPTYRTDALLVLLDYSRSYLSFNIIKFYLSANINKIYIVSYDEKAFSEDDYKIITKRLIEINKEELVDKIVYKHNPLKNFDYLETIIDEIEQNSFLLIVGIDKFANINSAKAISTTSFQKNAKINLHAHNSINWNEFITGIHTVFSKGSMKNIGTTMIYSLEDANNPANIISEASESVDSFDILCIAYEEDPIITKITELINKLSTDQFDEKELDNILETHKENLGNDNYYMLQGIKCLAKNDYITAEAYLQKLSDKTLPANLLLIANLYINTNQYNKAFDLLKRIYDIDKYLNGLMPALLEAARNMGDNVIFEEWLNKSLEINDMDCECLRYAANYYTENKKYSQSAQKWNALYSLTNIVEYKLLYDINIILDNAGKLQDYEIEQKLLDYAENYPEMQNEIYYRIAIILYEFKRDYKNDSTKVSQYLSKIDCKIDTSYAYEAALYRLKIYNYKISEMNTSDRKIPEGYLLAFARELIGDVCILTYRDHGNFKWSKYIEDTFHYEEWKRILIKIIFEKIENWAKIDKALFEETNVNINIDEDLFDNVIEIDNQNYLDIDLSEKSIILLFFQAINSVSLGEFQKANDTIFTLFRLAGSSENVNFSNYAIILGLTAWSNSNYKMGEEVESMISIIAAIDLAIECRELILPFMFGFVNVVDFLYNHANILNLDDTKKSSLLELINNANVKLTKSKYFFIIGEYNHIIENRLELFKQSELLWSKRPELEILINLREDEEEEFVNELKILIDAYYSIGFLDKACYYINKYKTTAIVNLIQRVDVGYRLFYEWSDILLQNQDYSVAEEFILLTIEQIEKLRTVFHKRERSFIGKQANKIYRKYLEIMAKQSISIKSTFENSFEIRDALVNIAPRAIIEQKLFNDAVRLNEELERANDKYYDLFYIINNMQKNGNKDENYIKHLEEFTRCKKYLEENHPNFKSLPLYNIINKDLARNDFSSLKNKLMDTELFFQIVLVDNIIIYNLISKEKNELVAEKIDLDKYSELLEIFKENVSYSDYQLLEKECNTSFIKLCDQLSEIFIKPLDSYLDDNKYKKLYFMPDLSLTYISMNYMRYKSRWIIQLFDSIENIIDFNVIGSDKPNNDSTKTLAHFLNRQDSSISTIYNMIKKQKYIDIQKDEGAYVEINQPLKSFILIGHGISKISGFNYIGAKSIKKTKKISINLEEYLYFKEKVENVLIISCSSGTLINDYAERNNGVWSSLFGKDVAFILYCKWDVSIEFTNILLKEILSFMKDAKDISLSEALVKAQRSLCNNHPILWSGLEVWKNQ